MWKFFWCFLISHIIGCAKINSLQKELCFTVPPYPKLHGNVLYSVTLPILHFDTYCGHSFSWPYKYAFTIFSTNCLYTSLLEYVYVYCY